VDSSLSFRHLLLLGSCMAPALGACTQDFGIFEPDGSADATTDGIPTDASSDSRSDGTGNDATNDAPTDTGGGLAFACGTGTVSDCAQCSGMPEPCVYCEQTNAFVLAGVCEPEGMTCQGAAPNGFASCQCGFNPALCPEGYQVCHDNVCHTCADSLQDNGRACKGGGQCNAADGGCN
jgi:hypothetical protein